LDFLGIIDPPFRLGRIREALRSLPPFLAHERALVAKLMVEHRLPSIYAYQEHVVAGGMMAFMTDYYDIFRREAAFIDKIVKGAKPGDLPVGEPTKFELERRSLILGYRWGW
jgi:putative tryptophan/tyrosine transport system substrate-binding protein